MARVQITNHKLQTSPNDQSTKPRTRVFNFGVRIFNLFGIYNLKFGIYRAARGFTLVELIVYVALLAVVAVVVTNSLLVLNRSITSFRLERRLTSNADVAMRRILRELRLANGIYASSTLGIFPGVLSLRSQESEGDAALKDVTLYVSGGTLMLRRATSSQVSLTADDVTINNLVFRQINNGTVSRSVKVELTLSASVGTASTTRNYYTTVVLRGNY